MTLRVSFGLHWRSNVTHLRSAFGERLTLNALDTGQTVLNLCDEVGVSPENITSNAEAEGDTFQEDGAVSLLKSGWTAAAFGLVASALLLM